MNETEQSGFVESQTIRFKVKGHKKALRAVKKLNKALKRLRKLAIDVRLRY